MLKLQHLTKRFGAAPLFTDLCMEVDAPVVLWAPSGWGKTTLLRILMGLERPTTGSVEGVGRVAAVFQEDRLCPQLNAVQNVTLVLPGAETSTKSKLQAIFNSLEWALPPCSCPPAGFPAGKSGGWRCCGRCGHPATPCCWTSPLPAWTRTPCSGRRRCCGSAARASRCCWLRTIKALSAPLAGR